MQSVIQALGAALCIAALPVLAQGNYPSAKPITIIVPFAAGSGTDRVARILAASMAANEFKDTTFVIDNRPGANGSIAAAAAAKATPDGYTLFMTTNSTQSVNPYIYKNLPYDPNFDFAPIALLGETAPALLTAASNPANSARDVIELARQKPDTLNFATTNTSSLSATQLLALRQNLKVTLVPYKVAPQALTDTVGGTIQFFFGDQGSAGELVRGGKLKALAVVSDKRLPGFPQVPTMAEAGYPGVEIPIWIGIFAPRGTPAALVERINRAVVAAQGREDVAQSLTSGAINVRSTSVPAFTAYVAEQYQRWGKLAKDINLQAE